MPSLYKRQHYVPASYLKYFAINQTSCTRNSWVWRCDVKGQRPVRVDSQCAENFHYSKSDPAAAEMSFHALEDRYCSCVDKDQKAEYFARWLYHQRSESGKSPCGVIDFVIHGGAANDAPTRLFEACYNPELKIPHLGVSSLGEMIGWAMPDRFPPRNGRTSKALTALGYRVKIHSE